jgi:uncharacterized protein YjiS (DUF1127 family)
MHTIAKQASIIAEARAVLHNGLRSLKNRWLAMLERERTRRHLSLMSDYQLADLGITRDEIDDYMSGHYREDIINGRDLTRHRS